MPARAARKTTSVLLPSKLPFASIVSPLNGSALLQTLRLLAPLTRRQLCFASSAKLVGTPACERYAGAAQSARRLCMMRLTTISGVLCCSAKQMATSKSSRRISISRSVRSNDTLTSGLSAINSGRVIISCDFPTATVDAILSSPRGIPSRL